MNKIEMLRSASLLLLCSVLAITHRGMSWKIANSIISVCWAGLILVFAAASIHARWSRREKGTTGKKDHRSLAGLLLQGIGIAVAVSFSSMLKHFG